MPAPAGNWHWATGGWFGGSPIAGVVAFGYGQVRPTVEAYGDLAGLQRIIPLDRHRTVVVLLVRSIAAALELAAAERAVFVGAFSLQNGLTSSVTIPAVEWTDLQQTTCMPPGSTGEVPVWALTGVADGFGLTQAQMVTFP